MYFHTYNYIYLTYFNAEIIVLDLQKDQYMILSEYISKIVDLALNNEFLNENGTYVLADYKECILPEDFDKTIKYLQETGILSKKKYNDPYIRKLKKGKFSAGAHNVDWRMSSSELTDNVTILKVLEAYFTLIKVYFIVNVFGFKGLIKAIKNKGEFYCNENKTNEFNLLVTALNKACFYFPIKTKCLEWSAALTFMGLRRKLKCNIEIGVQNLPFAAHAWVNADGRVIADIQDLPETLSVILSEPFNKGVAR